jgi:RNA polymerase sigma factor (sigma-70 family)
MSPLSLRRYRAERLLRREFDGLRARVLASVRGRLQASGARLDPADLEACYAQAWQGLYTALLAGEEISNVAGWLVIVTFRRAIDEHRARERGRRRGDPEHAARPDRGPGREPLEDRDLAAELDDRVRLRHLFEGLSARLSAREREAAVLCYLQGLSRSEAAERMGIGEARMRKLMEGRGGGRPGVAGKVTALVETVGAGGWCEEQGSLMRGLAYGMLDPQGDRYRLAVMHGSQCSACRAYVVSLRGLAAALPPVLLTPVLGGAGFALAGAGLRGGLRAAGGGVGAGTGGASTGAGGAGAVAGGGWMLAGGPLTAKLAVGCLLAVGVGAGCVALRGATDHPEAPLLRHEPAVLGAHPGLAGAWPRIVGAQGADLASLKRRSAGAAAAGWAGREFGPEHGLSPAGRPAAGLAAQRMPSARSASAYAPASGAGQRSASRPAAGASAAQREFAPG